MPPPKREHLAETLRLIFRESVGNLARRSDMIEEEFGERITPDLLGEGSFIDVRWYLHQRVYLNNKVTFPNSQGGASQASEVIPASPRAMTSDQEERWRDLIG